LPSPGKKSAVDHGLFTLLKENLHLFSAENGDQPDESNYHATEMTETKAVDDYKKTGKHHIIFSSVTKNWLSLYFCS
jgi:hypothetical protein